jgi:hypothetical protein
MALLQRTSSCRHAAVAEGRYASASVSSASGVDGHWYKTTDAIKSSGGGGLREGRLDAPLLLALSPSAETGVGCASNVRAQSATGASKGV